MVPLACFDPLMPRQHRLLPPRVEGEQPAADLLEAGLAGHAADLGSEAEVPSRRPGSLVLPTAEVRLLPVTGILFSNRPDWSRSSEEAHLVDERALFESLRLA